ncbi:MAG: GTPase HflX [Oligoflexus sp.]
MKARKRRGQHAVNSIVKSDHSAPTERSPAIIISIQTPDMTDSDVLRSIREISMLISDLGLDVKETFIQKRDNRNSPSYIGEGKLKEIAIFTGGTGFVAKGPSKVDMVDSKLKVIVDDELSPGQQRNLQSALGVEVIDRVAVILKIFENRASSKEAKLQVELAKLEYQLPRVKDDHALGDKEGGGGRASRGHTNVELSKQRIRHKISVLRREIESLAPDVINAPDFTVALIGYTNSGKSSIMQALTKEGIYVEDKLFATLGTTTRKICPPIVPPMYLTDTVGFIERLPHDLVASFRSTLAEARHAWLSIQVIDASDSAWRHHIEVSSQVIRDIHLDKSQCLLVFNKIDKLTESARTQMEKEFSNALFVSALADEDMFRLRSKLIDMQSRELVESRLVLNYEDLYILSEFRDYVDVVSEEYADRIHVVVRSTRKYVDKLRSRLSKHSNSTA